MEVQQEDLAAARIRLIRIASITALIGNAVLASLKIGVGLFAGSLAVVGDGIDSSTDVVIAFMSLIVAGIIARPADAEHPWGHGRAETIATTALAFILFFAGAQLIQNAIANITNPNLPEVPDPSALAVSAFSIFGKLGLAWSQGYFAKKANSTMLRANAKNMSGDVLISSGVLVGLALSIFLEIAIIDSIVAALVGLWVIKAAIGIFMETNRELMDGNADTELYAEVFSAVRSVPGTVNPHRARMRRIAGLWDIDIDIEVDPNLTVRESHVIATAVEKAIKLRVEGVYDIVVHIEPAGGGHAHLSHEEGFGLSEDSVKQRKL